MEFEDIEENEYQDKKTYLFRCEDCGYVWEVAIYNDGLFEEETQESCPMCGSSYIG